MPSFFKRPCSQRLVCICGSIMSRCYELCYRVKCIFWIFFPDFFEISFFFRGKSLQSCDEIIDRKHVCCTNVITTLKVFHRNRYGTRRVLKIFFLCLAYSGFWTYSETGELPKSKREIFVKLSRDEIDIFDPRRVIYCFESL